LTEKLKQKQNKEERSKYHYEKNQKIILIVVMVKYMQILDDLLLKSDPGLPIQSIGIPSYKLAISLPMYKTMVPPRQTFDTVLVFIYTSLSRYQKP